MISTYSYTLPDGRVVELTAAAAAEPSGAPRLHNGAICTLTEAQAERERVAALQLDPALAAARKVNTAAEQMAIVADHRPIAGVHPTRMLAAARAQARAEPSGIVAREILPPLEAAFRRDAARAAERTRAEQAAKAAAEQTTVDATAQVEARIAKLEAERGADARRRQAKTRLNKTVANALRSRGFESTPQAVAAYLNDNFVRTV